MDDPLLRVELLDGVDGARLSGELDVASCEIAEKALAPLFGSAGNVVLDISELAFVDSSGIRLFIKLRQALEDRGWLILRSPMPHVARVIEVAGLEELGVRVERPG